VFVFLFLISTGLAIWKFVDEDRLNQDMLTKQAELDQMNKDLAKWAHPTEGWSKVFVELITGSPGEVETAVAKAGGAYKQRDSIADELEADYAGIGAPMDKGRTGLANDMVVAAKMYKDAVIKLKKRDGKINELTSEIENKNAALRKQTAEHEQVVEKLNKEKTDLGAELADEQQRHTKNLKQSEENLAAVRKNLQQGKKTLEAQIDELLMQRRELIATKKDLEETLDEFKRKFQPGTMDIVNKIDGKIMKVAGDADVCYINLGSKNGIHPGMTFAVYAKGADNKEDVKGQIRTVKISDDFSECKIIASKKDEPIIVNDNIANIVYHAGRTYVFVVSGNFDLTDEGGNPTPAGRKEIEEAIRRFGGKVSDKSAYQTDYIGIGHEPAKPVKPSENATDASQKAYRQAMKRYEAFFKIVSEADRKNIPVLNKHRFLVLTGYMPEKKPE